MIHPRVLIRRLPRGAIVRRWDLDDEPAVLNDAAVALLDDLAEPVHSHSLGGDLDAEHRAQVDMVVDELRRRGIVWRI